MSIEINTKMKDNQLSIRLSGKLDAVSVKEVEKKVNTELESDESIDEVLLDLEELSYISSAGLRFIVTTHNLMDKRNGYMIVLNPCKRVMDVFSLTGIDRFLIIEKGDADKMGTVDHTIYPLRSVQRMMIDDHFGMIRSTMMNMGGIVHLDPSTDMEKLRDSINFVIHDHDLFRCRFQMDMSSGEIMQRFDGELHDVEIEDTTDEELPGIFKSLDQPYKLFDSCLWRLRLFRTETRKYLYVNFYHGIMDGVAAVMVFWREMNRYYKALSKGTDASELRHGSSSYAEIIRDELEVPEEDKEEAENYWKKVFEGVSEACIPPFDLDEEPGDNEVEYPLEGISKEYFMESSYPEASFFMGATLLTMAVLSGKRKAAMTWIHNGRLVGKERRVMGLMLLELPICWSFDQNLSVGDYLAAIEERTKEELQYRDGIGSVYESEQNLGMPSFIFQKGAIGRRGELPLGDTKGVIESWDSGDDENEACDNIMDIELNAKDDGSYSIVFDYDSGKYSEKAIRQVADTMKAVIRKMQDNCSLYEILGV